MSELLFDRFRVERELGAGSLGRVVLAADSRSADILVALKILRPELGAPSLDYLKNEFQVLRRLDHPGLAKALDFEIDTSSGNAYFSQEFIDGPNFVQAASNADSEVILKWGLSVARTLTYLSANGIVHGDLKPENVIVSKRGPALIDFGLAGAGSSAEGVSGTIAYLAPEILRGASPSQRTDLYSLGVLLYQALSGKLPYQADTLSDLLIQTLTVTPSPLRDLVPVIKSEVAVIIDRLLSRDPTRRYQAATGLARDLARCLGEPLEEQKYVPALLPLINREKELSDLRGWVDKAVSDGRGAMVIRGARGMGASRLMREAADYARTRGIKVVEVRFDQALGPYGSLPALVMRENRDSHLFTDEREAALRKFKFWGAVGDKLSELSARGMLMLALDDFEEASDSAHELVRYLVTRFQEAGGLLFIAAESDAEAPVPWADEIHLEPLSPIAVGQFAAEFWGEAPPVEMAERLARLSAGTPLFLREILRNMPPGADLGKVKAPESLGAMFTANLGRLEPDEIRLLEAIAVWGAPGSAAEIASLLDRNADELYGRLRKLQSLGFVRGHDGRFEIALPLFKRHIEDEMATGPRRKLHARAADVLVGRAVMGEEIAPEIIAHHFLEAGNSDLGADWALRAGERLQAIGANGEAAFLYQRALKLVGESDARRNKLLEGAGRSAAIAGMIPEALAAWRERIERAESDPPKLRASFHLEMARCQQRKGEYDRAERSITRALEEIADEMELSAGARPQELLQAIETRALVNLAKGRYDDARIVAEEAIKASGAGNPEAAPFHAALGLVWTYTGDYDSATLSFERAIEMFASVSDDGRQVLALSSLGMALQHRGDATLALEKYSKAFDIAREIGDLRAQATLSMNIASVHHQRGDYGFAITEYRRALTLAMQIGADADVARIRNNLGNLLIYLGRPEEARDIIEQSLIAAQRLNLKQVEGYNHLLRGDILKERGEMLIARKEYLRAHRILTGLGAAREVIQVELRLAGLYAEMGERERAAVSAGHALESARRINLRSFEAEAILHLARIDLKSGRQADAQAHARSALALAEGSAGPGLIWEIHAALGSALLKLNRLEEASKELKTARDMAIKLRDGLPEEYRDNFLSGSGWENLLHDMRCIPGKEGEKDGIGERWEKLLEINRQLNLEHDLTRLLELIMDSVLMLIRAERGFLIISREGKFEVPVARNIDRESVNKAKGKISRSIAEEVFKTGVPLITVDAQQDGRFDQFASVHDLKLRSVLCIPFKVKDNTVGTLYVDNRFQSGAFSQDDLRVMEAFADQAAIAIENARLIEENELKRRKLEANSRRIQSLVDELEQKVDRQNIEIAVLQDSLDRIPAGPSKYDYVQIVGKSQPMRATFALMDRVTDSNVPVLIEGESGTGKELVARAIHFNGPRKAMRFLSENCSAIPETLLESELFGYEKGAFTGAADRKIGLFEAADGGTIFLDEIGDMSLNMQSKLLRVLQEGELRRVGSEKEIHVDVRVISATHMRLEDLIRDGKFREDLYWRLNVVKIVVPPLRNRIEDIPLLIGHFVNMLSKEMGREVTVLPESIRYLMAYGWPGNVRELENELKKAALMGDGVVRTEDLSPRIMSDSSRGVLESEEVVTGTNLKSAVDEFEKRYLAQVIDECGGNRAKAAKKLGIARRTLYDKLERYGMGGEDED